MSALLSGKYDLNKTAVFMTQTGGGCRASNYIGFIRRALEKAGMPQIPVISVNANGMETNPGFTLTPGLITKAMQAVVYGDIFCVVLYATRPYEKGTGAANALHEKMEKRCIASLSTRRCRHDLNFKEKYRVLSVILTVFQGLLSKSPA